MHLQFPPTGPIEIHTDKRGVYQFTSAPIDATFPVTFSDVRVDHDCAVKDEAGTTLVYHVTELFHGFQARGYLRGVRHEPQDVISQIEHDERISTAIDVSFEAGRQMGVEEATKAPEASPTIVVNVSVSPDTVERLVQEELAKALDMPQHKGGNATWPPRYGPIGGNA